MNSFKNNVIKMILSGIMIFVLGFFIGYQYKNNRINSIQGYSYDIISGLTSLMDATNGNATNGNATNGNATNGNATNGNATNSNATNSNATNSNATNGNATNGNATNGNATNSNATNSNVTLNDNIIFLQKFELEKLNVKAGEIINVNISTTGACNSSAVIAFRNNAGISFTTKVEDISNNPHIIIPESTIPSTYYVTDLLLFGKNSDNTTFSKQYSNNGFNYYDFNINLVIEDSEKITNNTKNNDVNEDNKNSNSEIKNEKIRLENILIKSKSAKVGDKVYFDIMTSEKVTSVILTFTSNDKKSFKVYAKDIENVNPYFEIPSSVSNGLYNLSSVILSSDIKSVMYTKNGKDNTEKYNFNSSITVEDIQDETYIYNNEDINSDILSKLHASKDNVEIIINSDSNTLINEEIFNVIKGKNKKLIINYKNNQIVFDGIDIKTPKTIDATINVKNVVDDERINKLISEGIIVDFSDNGNLPGKALIRLKASDIILGDNSYIYYYNESTNNFTFIDTKLKKNNDYYEFEISHNSSYVIVNKKLDSKLIAPLENSNVVSFQKSEKVHLMLILCGLILIVAIVVFIIIINKKQKHNKKDK